MFQPPDHYHNLSLKLSEVCDDIGVNEILVMKRRRLRMLIETMENIHHYINNMSVKECNFGSQTEASTTQGLNSDTDNLFCYLNFNVIQDWSEWEVGKTQFLMIQDETTSPGYCLLQRVRCDVPLLAQGCLHEHHLIDDRGRVLIRHSLCLADIETDEVRHGPAVTDGEDDFVGAIHCLSWPKEANPWLQQENASGWPTAAMKRYSLENGCYVVPVDSKNGVYGDVEWRISTSLAERCLMFSLNMTQLRCYILMKMIIKCYIKPQCEEAVSSFMCKNVLFHCIAGSRPSQWSDCNLITCLNQCLHCLFNCILTEGCPHFIIARNNLLAGKLSPMMKQKLVEIMCTLNGNIEQTLLGICIDDLGSRIMVKSSCIYGLALHSAADVAQHVSALNVILLSTFLFQKIRKIFKNISNIQVSCFYQTLIKKVFKLYQVYLVGSSIEKKACRLLAPFFCSSISSVMASAEMQQYHSLSQQTLLWFSAGLNSEFPFLRLKLASALYCVGELQRCEVLLVHLERQLGANTVLSLCCCYAYERQYSNEFHRYCYERNEDVIIHNIALCVRYLSCEVNCIPKELKFELFRSTADDLPYRTEKDDWMDCAVVDTLPYLYFLQYKVYSQLHRPADQYRALANLARIIATERNLGHHETALNLLGQCMEQENRHQDALRCFTLSLNVRGRNNAAKWHICRMLAGLIRNRLVNSI